MTLSITRLVGHRARIKGTDAEGVDGQCTVDTSQWDDLTQHKVIEQAQADFDSAVEEFLAPINEAIEKANAAATVEEDAVTYVVLEEAEEGKPSQREVRVQLSHDSQILRLIEEGKGNRLVWMGDTLEILEAAPAQP